jgi:hypothetical protein
MTQTETTRGVDMQANNSAYAFAHAAQFARIVGNELSCGTLPVRSDGKIWVETMFSQGCSSADDWQASPDTRAYAAIVAEEIGVPLDTLMVKGKSPFNSETGWWVHAEVLLDAAGWASAEFRRIGHKVFAV